MDKQKQIEEMAGCKDCYDNLGHCPSQNDKEICPCYKNAVENYKQGYRKIPEGAVVLTRGELKEKIDCCDVSMIHHDDDGKRYIEYEKYEDFTDRLGKRIQQLKGQLKQERKETAEKFAEMVSKAFIGLNCIDIDEWNWCQNKIDEICKEIIGGGVE